VGWAYLVCVIDCCTREIVGWNLSHRCRTEDALAAVEQAVLERLPSGSRQENLTSANHRQEIGLLVNDLNPISGSERSAVSPKNSHS
jgi:transposase InsO family protein